MKKLVPYALKIITTVIFDSHGVVLIDYLEEAKTIASEYYIGLLLKNSMTYVSR